MNKILTIAAAVALCGCKEEASTEPKSSIYATNKTYTGGITLSERLQNLGDLYEKNIKAEQDYHAATLSNIVYHGFVITTNNPWRDGITKDSFYIRLPEGWVLADLNGKVVPDSVGTISDTIVVFNATNEFYMMSWGTKRF